MTELLFHPDTYRQEFSATVTATVAGDVALDRTAFYTGGGGQPCDVGVLVDAAGAEYPVSKIGSADGKIIHYSNGDLPAVGTTSIGRIDREHRYRLMRARTARHILCGVVWGDYGTKVTGGNMRPGAARMDFELEQMSAEFANEVEEWANAEVAAARPIAISNLSRAAAEPVPDLIRTKINLLPPNIQEVRTIDISGLDLQADSGDYVANTAEAGQIQVIGHESKGRINKRLRIALVD